MIHDHALMNCRMFKQVGCIKMHQFNHMMHWMLSYNY